MTKLPGGLRTETHQGRIYFPNLPPHLRVKDVLAMHAELFPTWDPRMAEELADRFREEARGEVTLVIGRHGGEEPLVLPSRHVAGAGHLAVVDRGRHLSCIVDPGGELEAAIVEDIEKRAERCVGTGDDEIEIVPASRPTGAAGS